MVVKINDKIGILTAEHVINNPVEKCLSLEKNAGAVMSLVIDAKAHRLEFAQHELEIFPTVRVTDEEGPDLAFISLFPSEKRSQLEAVKSSFNITLQVVETRIEEAKGPRGLHIIAGYPAALNEEKFDDPQFVRAVGMTLAPLITEVGESSVMCNGWDAVTTSHAKSKIDFAGKKLGGISGSGVWQAIFRKDELGRPVVDHITLAGIVFFDDRSREESEDVILLKAHGPISIYRRMVKMVTTKHLRPKTILGEPD